MSGFFEGANDVAAAMGGYVDQGKSLADQLAATGGQFRAVWDKANGLVTKVGGNTPPPQVGSAPDNVISDSASMFKSPGVMIFGVLATLVVVYIGYKLLTKPTPPAKK